MASRDPRVGVEASATEKQVWPEKDITGNNYDRRKAVTRRGIGNNQFVILPGSMPPDFDLEAAIAEVSSSKSSSRSTSSSSDSKDE